LFTCELLKAALAVANLTGDVICDGLELDECSTDGAEVSMEGISLDLHCCLWAILLISIAIYKSYGAVIAAQNAVRARVGL